MLSIGQSVTLKTQLFYGNANVRIDPRMGCISGQYVPQGATGEVKEMNAAEVLVEFY